MKNTSENKLESKAKSDASSNVLSINEIKKLIPHRYPLLLVDRILSISDDTIVGVKNITFNEPQFMGHFPDRAVMPGVLMIEALAQLSAILVSKSMGGEAEDKEVFFMAIENTKFRRIVEPGDTLMMEASIVQSRRQIWKFRGVGKVGDDIAIESQFTAMVKSKS